MSVNPHSSCYGIPNPGAATCAIWDPDLPPLNPSPLDDEFDSPYLLPKWTQINFANLTSYDVNKSVPGCFSGLMGVYNLVAAMQPIPNGDFTVYTKCRIISSGGSPSWVIGLLLADGITAGSGKQYGLQVNNYSTAAPYNQIVAYTNYSTTGSVTGYYSNRCNWLRIRRAGTTYYAAWTDDGETWTEVTLSLAFTPVYFGLHVGNLTGNCNFSFKYFRYFPSSQVVPPGGVWPGPASLGGWRLAYRVI